MKNPPDLSLEEQLKLSNKYIVFSPHENTQNSHLLGRAFEMVESLMGWNAVQAIVCITYYKRKIMSDRAFVATLDYLYWDSFGTVYSVS